MNLFPNSKKQPNRVKNRPSLTRKEAKEDGKATDQTPAQTLEVYANKTAEVKTGSTATVDNKPANIAPYIIGQVLDHSPQAEPAKANEIKAEPAKAAEVIPILKNSL